MIKTIANTLILFFILITVSCEKNKEGYQPDKSLSLEYIQSLIDSAETGDIITLPEGSVTWNEALRIEKGIILKGSGMDKTIIKNGRSSSGDKVIYVDGIEGQPFEISDIMFKGKSGTSDDKANMIFITGDCKNFRITRCKFKDGGSHSINTRGDTYGVIDHCEFINASQECIVVFHREKGDYSWLLGDLCGTDKAVYVEDCVFDFQTKGDHAITSNNGGRYVFRYNIITSAKELNSSQIDAHGNFFADRGTYSVEIYENILNTGRSWYGMHIRGGTGVIFNNTFSGDYPNPIVFASYRSYVESDTTSCGYVECDYPVKDQINNFFIWNNKVNKENVNVSLMNRGLEALHIQEGRDYYLFEKPGYEPFTYPHLLNNDND